MIGGGAAGMFAAISAAENGNQVTLLEKNEKLGKKIYITGKGRCNLTNDVVAKDFFAAVVTNPKFLYGAINGFSPQDTIDFFSDKGLRLKTERGNRVFPQSDKASDVTKTLEKELLSLGVDVRLNTCVREVVISDGVVKAVNTDRGSVECDAVIVCTGGASYPLTGSDGDGYKFAKCAGHSITPIRPALVGIELCGNDFLQVQGLSLKNVTLSATLDGKTLYSEFGEMLFTHFGISGPIVLSCSSVINKIQNLSDIQVSIDLKPALSDDVLDARLLREFKENNVKEISTVLRSFLPKSLIDVVLRQSGVKPVKNCSEITTAERRAILTALKSLKFKVKKLRPIEEAIVTSGGVNVKEINPKTMESKLVKGLYFAGEVLDVDAFTGGFNLQIAFSTGRAAGKNC